MDRMWIDFGLRRSAMMATMSGFAGMLKREEACRRCAANAQMCTWSTAGYVHDLPRKVMDLGANKGANYAEREEAEKQMLKEIDAAKGGIACSRFNALPPPSSQAFQDVGRRSIQDAFAAHLASASTRTFSSRRPRAAEKEFPSLCVSCRANERRKK